MCLLVGLCVPYIFVDPTKLHRGATPPSLMVLFLESQIFIFCEATLKDKGIAKLSLQRPLAE